MTLNIRENQSNPQNGNDSFLLLVSGKNAAIAQDGCNTSFPLPLQIRPIPAHQTGLKEAPLGRASVVRFLSAACKNATIGIHIWDVRKEV
jgi:hypothetical protein